jgi:hypothetical protein
LTGSGLPARIDRIDPVDAASEVIPPGSKLVNPIPDAVQGILRPKIRVFRCSAPLRKVQLNCPVPLHAM